MDVLLKTSNEQPTSSQRSVRLHCDFVNHISLIRLLERTRLLFGRHRPSKVP